MWWCTPHTTLLIIASLQAIKCQDKGSLVYVIDNTLSMTDDIEQVKNNTDMITKTIFEEASSQIQNMVLVTFNDPYAVLETKTERKDVFKSKIDDVYVHNNYGNPDCEEMSMTGILLALENSLPHSFIYVFTDATAKDYEKGSQIQKMCQEKQSQIVFVLTGLCSQQRYKPPFQVYYEIAAACSGLTLLVKKKDVSSIFVPIKDSIKGKSGMITSRTIPAYKSIVVPFEVNNGTEYIRVEAAGYQVMLSVASNHRRMSHFQQRLIWLPNVKVLRLTELTPGTYKAIVSGYSTTTINVVGNANDFSFNLGFSKLETTNLKDTMAQPIANSPTRLFISVNDSNDSINIESAQILNMDENVVATYELRRINKNYYTTVPFQAPSKMFKIAVIGKSTVSGKNIRHLAQFPITPQTEKKKPVIMISEGTSVKIEYGEALHLTCKVTAYPRPNIRWTDSDQKTLQSQVSIVKSPYEYVSYLSIPEVSANEFYYCHATNNIGGDNRTVEVLVKDPFDRRTPLNDTIQVKYGDKATLKCDIRSSKPIHITWTFTDKNRRIHQLTSANYALSGDSSVIQIKKMTLNTEGTYTCTAKLDSNKEKFKSHTTEVKLTGLTSPTITSNTSRVYKSIEGHDEILKIPCTVSGLPKPTITWKLRHRSIKPGSKYSLEDGFLVIKEPTIGDTATYVCQAQNDAGSVSASFIAQILQTPQITGDPIKIVTVGSSTSIECKVTKGVPTPTVSWQLMVQNEWKPLELSDSQKVLRIPRVSEVNAGRYKCTAKNIVGSSEYVTLLAVQVPPNITNKSTVYRCIEGQDSVLRIKCKSTGFPKPTITWTKGQKLIMTSNKYTLDEGDLVIKEPAVEDAGIYVCSARNELGSVNASFSAEILQIPQTYSEILKTVKAGSSTEIKCMVSKGVPAPTISWQVLREGELKFKPLASSDSVLYISTVSEKDAGRYKCIAHNIVDDAEHVTVLVVQVPPVIISNNSIVSKSIEGHNRILRIPCKVTGLPKPIMSWRMRNEFIPSNAKYSFDDEALIIKNLTLNDAGIYVCIATNDAGSVSLPFHVEILQLPKISGESSKTVAEGHSANIECVVEKGVPAPTIMWQFMAESESKFVQLTSTDHTLRIPIAARKDAGRYKCIAHNVAGDAEHVTIVNVQDSPRIVPNYTSEYKVAEGREKELRIPCRSTGLPKPRVTWEMKHRKILPNAKYSFEDDTLIINDPVVADTATYVCIASNEAGSTSAAFSVEVYQMPQVSGEASKTVQIGNIVDIECLIQKGMPAPKVTWQFMAKSESKFVNIDNGSENVLHILRVSEGDAGKYKCIAQNIAGIAEHDTVVVVEFAPYVTNKITGTMEGLEGDVALRIPCDVRAVPEPVISWSFNGTAISTGSHYSVTTDALIVMNPKTNDTGSYRCQASNYLGSETAIFDAVVKDQLDSYGNLESIKINKANHTSFKLECGSPGESVRWFVEGIDMNINSNYFELNDFDAAFNGNYTCRVSDMFGAYTKTYHAIIGSPPKFEFPQEETTFYWEGNDDVLDCSVGPIDRAKIKWTYNNEVLNENRTSRLGVVRKWGHYTCNVSNDFGEIHRTFDVISSLCLIPRNPEEYDIMPLILDEENTWPTLRSTSQYFTMEPGEKIKLFCPNYDTEGNGLKIFPTMQEITAICDKQDVFIVQEKPYRLKDLDCKHDIIPKVINTYEKCGPEQTNKIVVGYNVSTILETYQVCLDIKHNLPLYSSVWMPNNYDQGINNVWYKHPAINYTTNDNVYTCHESSSNCCYIKSQLVSANTIIDGPPQNSTFIDVINEVPLWIPCNDTKRLWSNIEVQIRYQLDLVPASMIWSGTHAWQNQNGHLVPRYIFKLIEFIEDSPLAVVYVNGPSPTSSDVLCKNICADGDDIWLYDLDDHVYCCTGKDFREAFNFYH